MKYAYISSTGSLRPFINQLKTEHHLVTELPVDAQLTVQKIQSLSPDLVLFDYPHPNGLEPKLSSQGIRTLFSCPWSTCMTYQPNYKKTFLEAYGISHSTTPPASIIHTWFNGNTYLFFMTVHLFNRLSQSSNTGALVYTQNAYNSHPDISNLAIPLRKISYKGPLTFFLSPAGSVIDLDTTHQSSLIPILIELLRPPYTNFFDLLISCTLRTISVDPWGCSLPYAPGKGSPTLHPSILKHLHYVSPQLSWITARGKSSRECMRRSIRTLYGDVFDSSFEESFTGHGVVLPATTSLVPPTKEPTPAQT